MRPACWRRCSECEQLRRQCARQQALQRAVGLPPPTAAARPTGKKQRRRRRPAVRALPAVEQLRQQNSEPQCSTGVNDQGVTP